MPVSVTAMTRAFLAAGLVVLAIAACRDADRPPDAAVDDTVTAVQPRTDEEIQRQAQPMTPQRAEELGVVDTTIHVTEEP